MVIKVKSVHKSVYKYVYMGILVYISVYKFMHLLNLVPKVS
jgi:hypothetical protein